MTPKLVISSPFIPGCLMKTGKIIACFALTSGTIVTNVTSSS